MTICFQSFEDEVESGNNVSMYPANESATDSVMFEPLPDILAKTVGSRALRPRITCSDEQRQTTAAKLVSKLLLIYTLRLLELKVQEMTCRPIERMV